ncbi:MAG: tetratricopeptide repeat protein [Acidobacteriota bacterium]
MRAARGPAASIFSALAAAAALAWSVPASVLVAVSVVPAAPAAAQDAEAPRTDAALEEEGLLMLAEGRRLAAEGRPRDALAFYTQALDMAQVALPAGAPALGFLLHELGGVYRAAGDVARAEQHFGRALAILDAALGPQDPDLLPALADVAAQLAVRRDDAAAQRHFERLVALLRLHRPPGDADIVAALGHLALSHDRQGRPAEAIAFYRQALAEADGRPSASSPESATVLNNLATLLLLAGDVAEAEPLYRRALDLRTRLLGPTHWLVAVSTSDLARTVASLGRSEEALDLATRAAAVLAPYCQGLSAQAEGEPRSAQELCLSTEDLRARLKGDGGAAPKAEPSPQSVDVRSGGTVYRAQVLAREDPDLAAASERDLRRRYGDLLDGVAAHIETIDLGADGIWYRLQFGDFPRRSAALTLCEQLLGRGWNDCWVTEAGRRAEGRRNPDP